MPIYRLLNPWTVKFNVYWNHSTHPHSHTHILAYKCINENCTWKWSIIFWGWVGREPKAKQTTSDNNNRSIVNQRQQQQNNHIESGCVCVCVCVEVNQCACVVVSLATFTIRLPDKQPACPARTRNRIRTSLTTWATYGIYGWQSKSQATIKRAGATFRYSATI